MDKLAAVTASPLFEMLSSEELERLAELCQQRHCPAGEVIFEEGQRAESLFIIVRGQVEVLGREGAPPRSLAMLGPSDFFGEMSLIDREQRSATLRAKTEVELLQLTFQGLASFRESHRDGFTFVIINIARALSARLREANARLDGPGGGSSR